MPKNTLRKLKNKQTNRNTGYKSYGALTFKSTWPLCKGVSVRVSTKPQDFANEFWFVAQESKVTGRLTCSVPVCKLCIRRVAIRVPILKDIFVGSEHCKNESNEKWIIMTNKLFLWGYFGQKIYNIEVGR